MKIAIDIDEVLADSMPKMLEFHTEKTGEVVKEEELYKIPYLGFWGSNEKESILRWAEFFNSSLSKKIQPVEGAQDAIKHLAKKHELFVVTGRPYSELDTTHKWINEYFPRKFDGIYFDNNHSYKETVEKDKTKSEICCEIGAKVLIDDLLKFTNNVESDIQVLLFNRPWNQGSTPQNVKRLNSWEEITRFIKNNQPTDS